METCAFLGATFYVVVIAATIIAHHRRLRKLETAQAEAQAQAQVGK